MLDAVGIPLLEAPLASSDKTPLDQVTNAITPTWRETQMTVRKTGVKEDRNIIAFKILQSIYIYIYI